MAWLVMAAALAYLVRNSVGVVESTIRNELELTATQSGWFMGAFFWSYAVFQVPGGWLGEVWGPRRTFTLMALLWSAAALWLGAAQDLPNLIAAYALMGVAQAGIMPCSATTISYWVPIARRSTFCGGVGMGLQIGAIAAGTLTAFLLEARFTWRGIYLLYALPGALWAGWFFLRFRDYPEHDRAVNAAELAMIREGSTEKPLEGRKDPVPWAALLTSPTTLWLCAQQAGRSAGYVFFASWFPSFLQTARGVSREQSGYLQSFVLAGALLGSISGGLLSDWVYRRTGSLRLSRSGMGTATHVICAVLVLSAFLVTDLTALTFLLSLGVFCSFAGGISALSTSIDVGGRHGAQVYAILNMAGCFAAAYTPVMVGWFFQTNDDWNRVLLVFAGIYLATAVCWALIDPTRRIERRIQPA